MADAKPAQGSTWPKRKKRKKGFRGDDAEMNMTPMIDVCFQLLVFFMVTSKFKTLEGKLAAYLPKDKGLQNYKIEEQTLPVRVVLRWNPTIKRCKVYVGQVLCNYDDQGIQRALKKVQQIKATGTDKAEIDAGGDVPMAWVVQALNMLIKADMPEINFTGAMDPLKDNK
ncbi:MAG: ExbD/TolR family protein [Planctomycetota bacterium]|jgi:biopolymer transport protein ExbD